MISGTRQFTCKQYEFQDPVGLDVWQWEYTALASSVSRVRPVELFELGIVSWQPGPTIYFLDLFRAIIFRAIYLNIFGFFF